MKMFDLSFFDGSLYTFHDSRFVCMSVCLSEAEAIGQVWCELTLGVTFRNVPYAHTSATFANDNALNVIIFLFNTFEEVFNAVLYLNCAYIFFCVK